VAKGILIDYDILGWAKDHGSEISRKYERIEKVGSSEIPKRTSDKDHGAYCNRMHLDFLTGDSTAYMSFLEAGISKVEISIFGRDVDGDKPVYLLKIVD
jgi:hypothetical protein